MLAAAVASCVSLMVAQELAKAHLKYDAVKTEAVLTLREKPSHWEVAEIELQVTCALPEKDEERFHKLAKIAKTRYPISRALRVPVKMTARLEPVEQSTPA
jgi:lipoyl-dependent peroxiredoxin